MRIYDLLVALAGMAALLYLVSAAHLHGRGEDLAAIVIGYAIGGLWAGARHGRRR